MYISSTHVLREMRLCTTNSAGWQMLLTNKTEPLFRKVTGKQKCKTRLHLII